MARYKVRDPEGNLREIEGPDGASDEEILAQAKQLFAQPAQEPVEGVEPANFWDKFNSYTSSIQSMADPLLNITARGAAALGDDTGIEYMKEAIESRHRGAAARGVSPVAPEMMGNIVGSMALTRRQGVSPTIQGRVAQSTAAGGMFGGGLPVEGEVGPDTLEKVTTGAKVGGVFGAAMEPVGHGIRYVAPHIQNYASQFFGSAKTKAGRMLNHLVGDKREAVIDALRNSKTRVGGEQMSAGEAAVPARSRHFSAIQKITEKKGVEKYGAIRDTNEAARMNVIEPHAAGPAKMDELIKARDAATKPLRDTALANANIAGQKGQELSDRLAKQQTAVVHALQDKGRFQTTSAQQQNLAEGGRAPSGNLSPSAYPVPGQPRFPARYTENAQRVPEANAAAVEAAGIESARKAQAGLTKYQLDSLAEHGHYPLTTSSVIGKLDAELSDPAIATLTKKVLNSVKDDIIERAGGKTTIDARALYTVRKELGDKIRAMSGDTKTFDKNMTAKIQSSVQKVIDDAIEKAGGSGWKKYLKTYVEKSVPIETAKTANALKSSLTDPLEVAERPAAFARAVDKADLENSTYALQGGADDVETSLKRTAEMNNMARDGESATMERIGAEVPKPPSIGMFSPRYNVVRSILNRFSDKITKGNMDVLVDSMDDPAKVLLLMEQSNIPKNVQNVVNALLNKGANLSTAGALYSGKEYTGGH